MAYETNEAYHPETARHEFVLPAYPMAAEYHAELAKKFGPQEKPANSGLTTLGSMLIDMEELELVNV